MATSGQFGAVARQISRLFGTGTVTGCSEGELLDRFVLRRDEAAFEALVARHGPMVLGVCRRLLDDPTDVEDAFQATFLILVKKAGTLRARDLLANWLYGVALRVAKRARLNAARRRAREKPGFEAEEAAMPQSGASVDDLGELRALLDEEVAQLPEKFRVPVLLCYLQGLTHDEAAARMRCPVGTVRSRLAKARDVLRGRLTRRGAAPASSFLAAGKLIGASPEVPAALFQSTIRAGAQFAASQSLTAGAVSASAALLAEGVLKTMALKKTIAVAMILTTVGAVTVTGGSRLLAQQRGDDPAQDRAAADPTAALRGHLESATKRIADDTARISKLETEVKELKAYIDQQKKNRLDLENMTKAGMTSTRGGFGGGGVGGFGSSIGSTASSGATGTIADGQNIGGNAVAGAAGAAPSSGEAAGANAGTSGQFGRGGSGMGMAMGRGSAPSGIGTGALGGMGGGMTPGMGGGSGGSVEMMNTMRGMRGVGVGGPNVGKDRRNWPTGLMQGPGDTVVNGSPQGDRIAVYDIKSREGKVYRAPKGMKVQPIVTFGLDGMLAVSASGPEVSQLAAYDFVRKQWSTIELKEPVKDRQVDPMFDANSTSVSYTIGRHVYAYSFRVGKWGVLTLAVDSEPAVLTFNGRTAYWQNESLHMFDVDLGRWVDVDLK